MIPNKLSPEEVGRLNQEFADKSPDELLKWALKTFGNTLALSCGFGPEGMCSLDMLMKIDRSAGSSRLIPDACRKRPTT